MSTLELISPRIQIMQKPITLKQLEGIVADANERFGQIRKKFPDLKAYLVYASSLGQAEIETPPEGLISNFPAMFIDNSAKKQVLEASSHITDTRIIEQLEIDPSIRIEIRFKDLKYDLVWKLQADELVDRKLTPQTKASIRIVLGTLERFPSKKPAEIRLD